MKKFLVLALVAVLSSVASATIVSMDQEGSLVAAPGQEITITVVSEVGLLSFVADVSVAGDASIIGATNASNADPAMTQAPLISGSTIQFNEGVFGALAAPIATFTFKYNGGTVTVDMVGSERNGGSLDGTNYSPVTVGGQLIVTPEPITVALLGLGGLFIRRK